MSRSESATSPQAIVERFFEAKERRDLDALSQLFSNDVVYTFPLPASGKQENWIVFEGKDATMEYQKGTMSTFSQLVMRDRQVNVVPDAGVVFVEARGDYVSVDGRPYKNVYVFKFVIRDDLISQVYEYANPVTYALFAGLPIAEQ